MGVQILLVLVNHLNRSNYPGSYPKHNFYCLSYKNIIKFELPINLLVETKSNISINHGNKQKQKWRFIENYLCLTMETEDRYRTARGLRSKIITQRNTKYRESENSLPGDSLCCCMSCSSLIQISIITGIFIIVFLPAIVRIIISSEHEMPTVSESVVIFPPINNGAF